MAPKKEEELEKKMITEIEGVRAMMVDRFSGVEQKLSAIEVLLKKLVETQNQVGTPLETGNRMTEKDMKERGVESSKIRHKGNKVDVWGGDDRPPLESGADKSLRAQIPLDGVGQEPDDRLLGPRGGLHLGDQGGQGPPWEVGGPYGWVGLYSNCYGKDNSPVPVLGIKRDFCGAAWACQGESDFQQKKGLPFGLHEGNIKGQFVNNSIEGCPRTKRGRGLELFGKKVIKADETCWGGNKSVNDSEKGLGKKTVKTGQDEILKDSLKSDQLGSTKAWTRSSGSLGKRAVKVGQDEISKDSSMSVWETKESWAGSSGLWGKGADKRDASGEEEEEQIGSWASLRKKKNEIADVSFQDSSKPALLWDKKDSGLRVKAEQHEISDKCGCEEADKGCDWSKKVEAKTDSTDAWDPWVKKCDNSPQAHVATEGSNGKGHEERQKPGSWGWKKDEGCGPKRKHPDSRVGESNDGPISSGLFTATKRRLDIFTSEEREIINDIEPIMQSIRKIMHQNGYSDGDPLSADDQTYILKNVFNHHPEKAQKMGSGVDYIM